MPSATRRRPLPGPSAVGVVVIAAAAIVVPSLAGCRPRGPRNALQDADPVFVIPAIRDAAESERLRDVPRLIELLESDDAAIRLTSIQALRRLTGETFGYEFWRDAEGRLPAVNRWKRWAVVAKLIPPEEGPTPEPWNMPTTPTTTKTTTAPSTGPTTQRTE